MEVKKAVITAAGPTQRTLPLQSLVDRDGAGRTALAILLKEVLEAGIDSVGVVINPGDESEFTAAAGEFADRIRFIPQTGPRGYADAIHRAAGFTGDDPFLLLVGDHLYVSGAAKSCARQLLDIARAEGCAVSAVQATHESKLPYYGAVGGKLVNAALRLYQVDNVLEKPTPTEAEQSLIVPGLRSGFYLCFFGMHVLMPATHRVLAELLGAAVPGAVPPHLRQVLARLAVSERYLACELDGRRYDIGVKYGLLTAQLALALAGVDRDEVLAGVVELLAAKLRGR
jgi:UTP--glucose-1-phosphate uridylyltransferase